MGVKLSKMTLKSLFRNTDTVLYPLQEAPVYENLKGTVSVDIEQCILCGICQKRCPTGSITVDKAEKTWAINRFSCVQCELCITDCPKHCLTMSTQRPAVATAKTQDVFTHAS